MKKASGMIEIALLACFVVCITFALMKVFNNQKIKLTQMSQVKIRATK